MPSHFSKAFPGLILTLLSPTLLSRVCASPASGSSSIPTAIVTAPSPSSTSTLKIPQCAQSCLTSATLAQPCDATDTQCLCAHSGAIKSATLTCLASSNCSQEDINITVNYYNSLCVSLGYPLTALPTTSIESATSATTSPLNYATAKTSNSTTPASQSSTNTSPSLEIPIIVGTSIGAALILTLTLITCFVIYRRRCRAREDLFNPDNNAPGKESQFSNSSTAMNPTSEHTKTMLPTKSFSSNRPKSSTSTITMASLTLSEKDGTSHPNRHTVDSNVYTASNYSTSHSAPSRHRPSTLMWPISPILQSFSRAVDREKGTEKELPSEPRSSSPQLSPALAAFDFGIGRRDSTSE